MRSAVIGHVEWVQFARVESMPQPGEIVHADSWWEEAGGGGAGAASQLAKLTDETIFFTSLGDDELGHRAAAELADRGIRVEATLVAEPTRRAITHVDASGERTITVMGERAFPRGADELPWGELDAVDAVYFTAGDRAALQHARRARVLVATSRTLSTLAAGAVELDALVGSALDPSEAYVDGDLVPPPRLVVRTEGERGGSYGSHRGEPRRYLPAELTGPIVDRYGAGDSFAAALAYGLAAGSDADEAIELAARCGAAVLTGRGPHDGQLTRGDLGLQS